MLGSASRRRFLKQTFAGSTAIGLATAVPDFLLQIAAETEHSRSDRVLVVVQLSGGNDGLNTVIPYADEAYYQNRFTLAIGRSNVLKINDHVGLHPALGGFSKLLEQDRLAIVQGVGYPNPNRSHFESMDLWHTAHRVSEPPTGWLGQAVGGLPPQSLPAMHLGRGLQPLALKTDLRPIPSIRSLDSFRLRLLGNQRTQDQLAAAMDGSRPSSNSLLSYVQQSAEVAIETSRRLESLNAGGRSDGAFPETPLGRDLSSVAQLIDAGLSTQIYYVTLDGFDTHANQAGAHQGLLQNLGDSVAAFMEAMDRSGHGERVTLLAFSEFGRRVRENASRGTDHGAAAPVFVAGHSVRAGVLGDHPSLTDLDQGDLKFQIDYRNVYADLLSHGLQLDPARIVGNEFTGAGLYSG